MCLAMPCKVLQVADGRAEVLFDGVPRWVQALGVPDLMPGEYVTVHAGVVLERMPAEAAEEILRLYADLGAATEDEGD